MAKEKASPFVQTCSRSLRGGASPASRSQSEPGNEGLPLNPHQTLFSQPRRFGGIINRQVAD